MPGEVFDPELIKSLKLGYTNGTVRTLNKTGYMRNHLCEISQRFCAQEAAKTNALLEIGCGIGAVLNRLMQNGHGDIVGVDCEPGHLDIATKLVQSTMLEHANAKLTMICDSLPHLTKLAGTVFDSVLCAQVLHYLRPDEFEDALVRLFRLLKVGGTLYVTVGSPYNQVYKGFGDEYERRAAQQDKFPGYMEDVRKYHPTGANHNPGFSLYFDPLVLARRVAEAGFTVVDAAYIDREKNSREPMGPHAITGLMARKP